MAKQTTKSFRRKCALEAAEAYKNDITYTDTAKKLGVSVKSLWSWVRMLKNGELDDDGDRQKDFKQSADLDIIAAVTDEFKRLGATEPKTIDMMVFTGNIKDKNFLVMPVENPDITDPDEYDQELKNRIMSGLKYGFAATGFKLMEDDAP